MKKTISTFFILLIIILTLCLNKPSLASADVSVAGDSAQPVSEISDNRDFRITILKSFFKGNRSPLEKQAQAFVKNADKYGLDWRLIPAITGVESTYGKRIPSGSFNAYGWANGEYRFESWEESIEKVSSALRQKYIDRGAASIEDIGVRYAPPSSTWAGKVKFIMRKISVLPVDYDL